MSDNSISSPPQKQGSIPIIRPFPRIRDSPRIETVGNLAMFSQTAATAPAASSPTSDPTFVYPKYCILKNDIPSATIRILPNMKNIETVYVQIISIKMDVGAIPPNSVSTMSRLIGKNDTAEIFFAPSTSVNPEEIEVWCLVKKGRAQATSLSKKFLKFIIPYLKMRPWKYVTRAQPVSKMGYLRRKSKADTKAPFLCIDIDKEYTLWAEENIYRYVDSPTLGQESEVHGNSLPQPWHNFAVTLELLLANSPSMGSLSSNEQHEDSTEKDTSSSQLSSLSLPQITTTPSSSTTMVPSPLPSISLPQPSSFLQTQTQTLPSISSSSSSSSSSTSSSSSSSSATSSSSIPLEKKPKLETFIAPTLHVYDKSISKEDETLLYYYYFIDFIPEKTL